jgi:hypothetical protein
MMRYELLSFGTVAVLASITTLGVQELTRTVVVNLKDPHPVEGEVSIDSPIPHSDTASVIDVVVAPASRDQTGLWTDVGSLDTTGFTSVVLSLHGQFRGSTSGSGAVALVLVPDAENVIRALDEGEVHLELEVTADPARPGALYFSGTSDALPVGFSGYRMFLYNTTERSASVDVYAYLTN